MSYSLPIMQGHSLSDFTALACDTLDLQEPITLVRKGGSCPRAVMLYKRATHEASVESRRVWVRGILTPSAPWSCDGSQARRYR